MKISFPKYGAGELLTRKPLATCIISFVAIAFFAGVCGSYLLGNKLWLSTIAALAIAGILLCLGVAVAIFLNKSEVNETPSVFIEENVRQLTPQWDYRPRKPIRARAVLESPSTETSDDLSSDPFGINDNAWFNNNPLEDAAPIVSGPPETEETITEALSQTSDPVCASPTVDDEASEVRLKSHRQSNRRR
jgi:hypothetical protein